MPARLVVLGLTAVALSATATVAAQAEAPAVQAAPSLAGLLRDGPPTPLAEALADADGDGVPDALGDTVLVGGRATVASGQLHKHRTEVFIEDGTGGLRLLASSTAPYIAEGDSVLARGALTFELGMPRVADPAFVVVPAPPRTPAPVRLDLRETPLETYEGRLVEVHGTVVEVVRERGREVLLLLADEHFVQAFVYTDRPVPVSFEGFGAGDYIRVRGIAGQFDREPPFDASYAVFPRGPGDVARAGLPPAFYRGAALVGGGLLGLALLWVGALRRVVARRARELRATEVRYAHLIDAASDAVFVHDAAEGGRIVEANRVARKALGFTQAELTRADLAALAASGAAEAVRRHLDRARSGLEATDVVELRTRAGEAIPFEVRTRPVLVGGQAVLLSLARDVAARQAYERGLVEARHEAEHSRHEAERARGVAEAARQVAEHAHCASEQARLAAEELARLKGAFLANMSHEIRTPLTAIIGFAEVLTEEVGEEQRALVRTIEDGGKRLLDTLNAVLDLARLDAGREVLRPRPLDLVEEVRRGLALLAPLAEEKDLALVFQPPTPSIPLRHDPTALDRVLTNLVGNAVKFTARGGVRVVLEPLERVVRLHVQDTGIGMDEAFLPHLFDEFKQESEGYERTHEGSGLGLAIAKRLVDLMGGTIGVTSRKGFGTTFTATLPYDAPRPADVPSADMPSGDGATGAPPVAQLAVTASPSAWGSAVS